MYRKILVGTDGSATATRAVDRAVEVAATLGASLTVLTVMERRKGEALLEREAARLAGAGVELDTRCLEGDPAGVLVEEADGGGYDLLVVGNKGMTGATRFLTGSVPNKVSHRTGCSLLIVRTT